MQHVCHILPLNGYLHRIEKHPTGDCPWCPGTRESQMHFHSECSEFEPHRTAAHHAIAKATISALRELNPQGGNSGTRRLSSSSRSSSNGNQRRKRRRSTSDAPMVLHGTLSTSV